MTRIQANSNGTSGSYYKLYLEYTQTKDTENNKSRIKLHMWAQSTSSIKGAFNGYKTNPVKIYYQKKKPNTTNEWEDAVYVIDKQQAIDFRNLKVVEFGTWEDDISHNADGTLTLKIGGSYSISGVSGLTGGSISKEWTLENIPRKSSVTATNANIESNTKIEIKRASDSFTHTLKYSFEGLTGTIVTKTSNTSISWTIPTSFYAKIPNNKKGTCTITCETYSGTTLIGSTTTTFEASCNETKCKPTVSATVVDTNQDTINLTNDSSKLIKYKSTAKITPTTTAKNSATISRITIDNVNVTSYLSLANVSKNAFEITVTDSRGFSNTITKNVTMINYVQLTCKADFERTSQTSSEVKLKYSGNYFNGSFGAQNNTLAMSWSYCEKGTNDWISGGILNPTISGNTYSGEISCGTTFNYKNDYEFKLYYADELDNLNLTKDVSKGEGSLEIYDKALVVGGEDLVTWYNDKLEFGETLLNPFCEAYQANNSTTGSTSRLVVKLDTFVINEKGFELSDYGIKMPKAGIVSISASLMISPFNGYCGMWIYKNNTAPIHQYYSPGKLTYGVIEMSNRLLEVSKDDVLYLKFASDNGSDIAEKNTRTRMTIQYLK